MAEKTDLKMQDLGDRARVILVEYARLMRTHAALYARVAPIKQAVLSGSVPTGELSDVAFLTKKCAEIADDMRKEVSGLCELAGKTASLAQTQLCVASNNDDTTIRGMVSVGSPNVEMAVSLPSHTNEPERYARALQHFGVPVSAYNVVRLHWPSVCQELTELARRGRPGPQGVFGSEYPVHKLSTRARRGVDVEAMCQSREVQDELNELTTDKQERTKNGKRH